MRNVPGKMKWQPCAIQYVKAEGAAKNLQLYTVFFRSQEESHGQSVVVNGRGCSNGEMQVGSEVVSGMWGSLQRFPECGRGRVFISGTTEEKLGMASRPTSNESNKMRHGASHGCLKCLLGRELESALWLHCSQHSARICSEKQTTEGASDEQRSNCSGVGFLSCLQVLSALLVA